MMQGKKFVASYSGGKDSVLALYRAVRQGMEPMGLVTTYRTDLGRSWFHGVSEAVLQQAAKALCLPAFLIETTGEDYGRRFVRELQRQKELGCQVCVFGDIDIEEHLDWCRGVCREAGVEAYFPLWQQPREALVKEFIAAGFTARLTVVDTSRLSQKHLGMVLSEKTMDAIRQEGADVCGENGEYHSFVTDGPLFSHPVPVRFGRPFMSGDFAILPMDC